MVPEKNAAYPKAIQYRARKSFEELQIARKRHKCGCNIYKLLKICRQCCCTNQKRCISANNTEEFEHKIKRKRKL